MEDLHVPDVLLYHGVLPPIHNGGLENHKMRRQHFLFCVADSVLSIAEVLRNHANPLYSPKGLLQGVWLLLTFVCALNLNLF